MPYTTQGVDEEVVQSFIAALQLGLKKCFGGKVDHLRITTQEEPGRDGGPRRAYVLLYDSVPGGTGYLHQLLAQDATTLVEVFKQALEVITHCPCTLDAEKDGCYRCVYQYRLGRVMDLVSRDRAREVLGSSSVRRPARASAYHCRHLHQPPLRLSAGGPLYRGLRHLSGVEGLPTVKLVQDIVNGKSGYLLEVAGQRYWIEPQVELADTDGVRVACKPDFVIWAGKASACRRPIAIFCDGWTYHRETVREDAQKRNALVTSGRFWVWSVTSDDVKTALDGGLSTDLESPLTSMNAPLAQWRVFLHPLQKRLGVGNRSGPVRVLGGAGTGKTVLAMHRARWLAEHATPEGKKVLVTTFTRNLAIDIEANLNTLCTREIMQRIEVPNLDAWVLRFLRSKRYEQSIVYGRQDEAAECWHRALAIKDAALGFDNEFYAAELEQVVLAQGVTTLDAYRAARRVGRGVVLSRAKRDAIWPVFEEYRAQLASHRLKEVDDAYRDAAQLISKEQHHPYSAIVIDETQDFGPQALRLLRALIEPGPNDLFFVGDGHQRIYPRHKAAMSRSGIDIRGRARKLYINYRTTDEIRRQAVALLEGVAVDDLDDGTDNNTRYKSLSHGPAPILESCPSREALVERLQAILATWAWCPRHRTWAPRVLWRSPGQHEINCWLSCAPPDMQSPQSRRIPVSMLRPIACSVRLCTAPRAWSSRMLL